MSMLSIGITGIQAAQLGLATTQHNIANANSTGYSRQFIQQSAGIPTLTGAGYIGSGTTVDSTRRAYDKYLTIQSFSAQASASESDAQLAKLNQIDNMLGDQKSGLSTAMQDFFSGVQQAAANPSLASARQSMLSSAQTLASRLNSMSGQLNDLYGSVNGEIADEIQVINGYAQQLADVNGQITRAEAAAHQSPNDLLDMRDQLVAELNKHVRVSTVEDSSGNLNVFLGSGQQLVAGAVVNKLVPVNSKSDPERVVVGWQGQSGTPQELSETLVEGGALGGLLKFRSNSLDDAANTLGQVAASLALTFNAQHALGQDLNGLNKTSGSGFQSDFFEISQPRVLGDGVVTASFLPPNGDPATGNFSTGLTGSDYVLRNDGTNLKLTRQTDGKTWSTPSGAGAVGTLNGLISSEGFQLGGSASPTVGVDYKIEPTRGAAISFKVNSTIAADTNRIALAAPSKTDLGDGNTGSMVVSQGAVGSNYLLSSLPTFTYSPGTPAANGSFAIDFPGEVTATYADGNSVSGVGVASVNRLYLGQATGAELTRITYNGISIDISGTPAKDDTFSITTNSSGVSDNRNAVKLAALQTQNTMKGGKATFQATYASLVGSVGSDTSQVKSTGAAQNALLAQNASVRSSVSGVNLDEEAANLVRYQQAYQASAKAFEIASKLFDTLLSISG